MRKPYAVPSGIKFRLCMILSLVLIVLLLAAPAYAETTKTGFVYETDENGEVTVTGYTGTSDVLRIPESIDGKPVTAIADFAFEGNTSIRKAVIPLSVKTIGANPFLNCTGLYVIYTPPQNEVFSTIEGSLYQISDKKLIAFPFIWNWYTIPDGVEIIGERALSGNTLQRVTLPDTVLEIRDRAFAGCTEITSVEGAQSCTVFGEGAFADCPKLETVTIPAGTKMIPDNAFRNCVNLKSLTLPTTVTSIGENAFSGCSALETISLPSSLRTMGERVFAGCTSLKKAELPGLLKSMGAAAYMGCSALESVKLPLSLKTIPDRAFEDCTALKNVTLNGVKTIGTEAFAGCGALRSLMLPEGLMEVGTGAFSDCTSLKSVTLPSTLTVIPDSMFINCSALSSVTLPKSLKEIQSNAFGNCGKLYDIRIPASVTHIDSDAFTSYYFFFMCVEPDSYAQHFAAYEGICYYYPTSRDWLTAAARKKAFGTVGNSVSFGSYEQDNNPANGKEEIEWIVLDVQGDRSLLISKYALDCKKYNTEWTDGTWESCSLRKWLNSDFLNAAFS